MRGLWGGLLFLLELRILCVVGLCKVILERYVSLDFCGDGYVFFLILHGLPVVEIFLLRCEQDLKSLLWCK